MNLMSRLQSKKKSTAGTAMMRHDAFIGEFLDRLSSKRKPDPTERYVSIIARSPASPVVSAVIARRDELTERRAGVQAIFADLGPDGLLAECAEALDGLCIGFDARESFRWARNACLMDAHEQLILGTSMCWSGDCMRREPGKVDALDLFEIDAPKVVRLGTLAFDAIWAISDPVPSARLRTATRAKPSASYGGHDDGRLSAFSLLRKPERANSLTH
jgi:hypothetical protein